MQDVEDSQPKNGTVSAKVSVSSESDISLSSNHSLDGRNDAAGTGSSTSSLFRRDDGCHEDSFRESLRHAAPVEITFPSNDLHKSISNLLIQPRDTTPHCTMQHGESAKDSLENRGRKRMASDASTNNVEASAKKACKVPETIAGTDPSPSPRNKEVLLLAQPTDESALSPLHTFVRKQIEVFTATETDIQKPAPGRKHRIRLHQVGLRCIHCRHLETRNRVKRAICYPSAVGRIYHSVSDMKFDHFAHCKGMPAMFRAQFDQLKSQNDKKGRNQGNKKPSAAQYYHDCARQMGMVDRTSGVFMGDMLAPPLAISNLVARHEVPANIAVTQKKSAQEEHIAFDTISCMAQLGKLQQQLSTAATLSRTDRATDELGNANLLSSSMVGMQHALLQHVLKQQLLLSLLAFSPSAMAAANTNPAPSTVATQAAKPSPVTAKPTDTDGVQGKTVDEAQVGRKKGVNQTLPAASLCLEATSTSPPSSLPGIILGSPKDSQYLNPLHCYVRRHVQVFAANAHDLAEPSPGRKVRIRLGQVGLRCIHCASTPAKQRVKRSVCYPPSVGGIYHAVSNMKHDHFGKCQALSAADRQEFLALRRAPCGGRRSSDVAAAAGGNDDNTTSANSTSQYYHDSALAMGLMDTAHGIRFQSQLQTKQDGEQKSVVSEGVPVATQGEAVPATSDLRADGMSVLAEAAAQSSVLA